MSVIELVKTRRPVVHCITNYVTAESVANALLAAGASPIMTDDPEEVADVDRIADAVCLNLGTWSRSRERAILTSAKAARGRGIPIALDPVGVGASDVRLETARRLIFDIGVDIIRGNSSEIAPASTLPRRATTHPSTRRASLRGPRTPSSPSPARPTSSRTPIPHTRFTAVPR